MNRAIYALVLGVALMLIAVVLVRQRPSPPAHRWLISSDRLQSCFEADAQGRIRACPQPRVLHTANGALAMEVPRVSTIVFGNGKPLLILHSDGKVDLADDARPTEAAKEFIQSLRENWEPCKQGEDDAKKGPTT